MIPDRLLSDHDLASITGRSRSSWQKDRLIGGPNTIPFIRVGRLVRYEPADVRVFLDAQKRLSTSDTRSLTQSAK